MPAAPAPAKPFDALQDSQLFDAESSEPLSSTGGGSSSRQDWPRSRSSEVKASGASRKQRQTNGSTQRNRARGTEAAVLYGVMSDDAFSVDRQNTSCLFTSVVDSSILYKQNSSDL